MSRVSEILRRHGVGAGGQVKVQDYLDTKKALADLSALVVKNAIGTAPPKVAFDTLESTNANERMSFDGRYTRTTQDLTVGQTVLTDAVENAQGFSVGEEITIKDDVNTERVFVTRADTETETATHNVSTPTTVVNSAFDTSGNGGRKLVRLSSNGWLIAVVRESTTYIRVYKSTDNGQTWTQITYMYRSSNDIYDVCVVSSTSRIYVLATVNDGVVMWNIDPVTVTNTDIYSNRIQIDSGQTANVSNKCSLTINEAGTELHAAWSSKNSTYPNSFNIRYAKGTINGDGSVTWGSVEQATIANLGGAHYQEPCIVIDNFNRPSIAIRYISSTQYYIVNLAKHISGSFNPSHAGTGWGMQLIHGGGTYVQSTPCAVVDNAGVIHVVWHGRDATDATADNIRYSKSTDGGETWSAVTKLTSGNSFNRQYPSISVNSSDKLFVVFTGQGNNNTGLSKVEYDGSVWSSVSTLDTNSSFYPSTLDDKTLSFSDPLVIFVDNTSSVVKFRGVWEGSISVHNLEVTPLTKNFKLGAVVGRSTVTRDTTTKKLKSLGMYVSNSYNVLAPTTVVSSAYDTSGNGGRKLVRLSNGWLVAVIKDYVTGSQPRRLYISKDSGNTWEPFGTINNLASTTGDVALVAVDTKVYCLQTFANVTVNLYVFDENGNLLVNNQQVDGGQSSFGNVSLAVNSAGTELHAAWASKNSTYPNGFNIRYAKGTINGDGTVTWSAPTQITTVNTSGVNHQNPCVVVRPSNGYPTIIWDFSNSGGNQYGINSVSWNGSSFGSVVPVQPGITNYAQSNPCAVVDNNGVIHVVWHGKDATDSAVNNIRYSKSTDGGATWSAATKLTSGNTNDCLYPTITFNASNGNIYVLFHKTVSGEYRVYKTVYSSGAWSNDLVVFPTSQTRITYPSALVDNTVDFSDPLIVFCDASSVKFRGKWVTIETIPFMEDDIRYNYTPDTTVASRIQSWFEYDNTNTPNGDSYLPNPTEVDIEAHLSIVSAGQQESYIPMIKRVKALSATKSEALFMGGVAVANSKITQRITVRRQDTTKHITRLLGHIE
jgi:hypothetical protein